jgi:hypothetical protein
MEDNKQNVNQENNDQVKLDHSPYARATFFSPIVRVLPKIGRNALCPLESKKFKNCCGKSGQDFCTKAKENLENYINELKAKQDDKSS